MSPDPDTGTAANTGTAGTGAAPARGAGLRRRAAGLTRSPILLAIVGGIAVGALIALASGHNPLTTYAEILRGAFEGPNRSDTIGWAVPMVGMALVVALPLRGGMVNLGGDGQLVVGGLVSAVVATSMPGPGPVRLVVAVLAAMAASAAWAALPALADATLGVPLLISTLLLNYPARYIASYLVRFPLRDEKTGLPQTRLVPGNARIPELSASSQITGGLVLVALVAAAIVWFDRRTPGGYELRMRGANPRFAAYGGVPLGPQSVRIMAASGAIAGLVGAILVLGVQYRFTDGALLSPGYTWTGLMAALLAGGQPIGTVVAAFSFAALQIGGFGMERATQIPRELTAVLQAVIILFLAARSGLVRRPGGPR